MSQISKDSEEYRAGYADGLKVIGIACDKHDLTHSISCGICFADMKGLLLSVHDTILPYARIKPIFDVCQRIQDNACMKKHRTIRCHKCEKIWPSGQNYCTCGEAFIGT